MRRRLLNIKRGSITPIKSAILPFNGGTTANIRIATVDDSDWTIDWGDGTVETYPSSSSSTITHTYASSFTGDVIIYGDVSYLYSTTGSYDFTNVVNFTNLTHLQLISNQFTGDMSGVSSLTSLTYLFLFGSLITGNMSGVSGLTSLTYLYLQGDQFTGDMSGVSSLTSLTYLQLYSTQFTGNMTGVTSLTLLTTLRLSSNLLTGDMSGVSGLTLLNTLYLLSTQFTYTYSPLSADFSDFFIRIKSGELSNPTDIDNILIDIDNSATSGGGTIDLRSTGAASPTAASAAAVSSLTSKGRTVLTN